MESQRPWSYMLDPVHTTTFDAIADLAYQTLHDLAWRSSLVDEYRVDQIYYEDD